MKMDRLAELFDFYQFSIGSLGYIVSNMRDELEEIGNSEAVEQADKALKLQEQAAQKRYAWKQGKKKAPLEREGSQKLDNEIDAKLSNFLQALDAFSNMSEGSEKRQRAEEVIGELLPRGVYPITSETFNDQHDLVNQLVDQLNGPFASHMQTLGLEGMVQEIDQLNTEFGKRLDTGVGGVEYDEVRAAHMKTEDAFHGLVGRVVGTYTDDLKTLNQILAPVFKQTERTRRYLQRRGTIPEVDPETGEPVEPQGEGESPEPSGDGETTSGDGETTNG